MKKLKKQMENLAQRVIDMTMGNGLMQEETSADGERYVTPGICAAEIRTPSRRY
jgi:hypothetical protein